jgi:hypothetical protein
LPSGSIATVASVARTILARVFGMRMGKRSAQTATPEKPPNAFSFVSGIRGSVKDMRRPYRTSHTSARSRTRRNSSREFEASITTPAASAMPRRLAAILTDRNVGSTCCATKMLTGRKKRLTPIESKPTQRKRRTPSRERSGGSVGAGGRGVDVGPPTPAGAFATRGVSIAFWTCSGKILSAPSGAE